MNGLLRIETFLKLFNIFQFETIFSTYEFLVDPLVHTVVHDLKKKSMQPIYENSF